MKNQIQTRTSRMKRVIATVAAVALLGVSGTSLAFADETEDLPTTPELINVALSDSELAPEIEVSYVPGWNSVTALNDGKLVEKDHGGVWGTYGDSRAQHYAQYTWETPVVISSSTVWFWNDEPEPANVRVPGSWSLQYWDDAAEEFVDIEGEYPIAEGTGAIRGPNAIAFDPIETTKLRFNLNSQPNNSSWYAVAASEWEVEGYFNIAEPEPENPNEPIDWETVAVRLLPGQAPTLPDKIWGVPQNGPLSYYSVDWEVPADANTWTGTHTIKGSSIEFGTPLSAQVHVVSALDSAVDYVEYSATITTPGVAPVCPLTVLAAYEDGSAASNLPVTWQPPAAASYAQVEQFGDITGTVTGTAETAICTFFVVDPEEGTNLPPIVSVELDSSPDGTGWYLTAPSFTVVAEALSGELATIEYSIDAGETWLPYTEATKIAAEGEVTVSARATDDAGRSTVAQETIRVDTKAPVTGIKHTVDAKQGTAQFTLTATDAEPGSGLRRVLFSYGTSADPTDLGNNEMWATYEEPFSVSLRDVPVFVHIHSQDAAGHQEITQTIELELLDEGPTEPTDPPVEPTDPPVEPTDPPVEPTDPPVEPTDPPVEPTDPVEKPEPTEQPDSVDPADKDADLAETGANVTVALLAAVGLLGLGLIARRVRRA